MSLTIQTDVAVEPVTLDEVKDKLKIVGTTEDATLQRLISVAREYGELMARKTFAPKTLVLSLDRFPYGPCSVTLPGGPIGAVLLVEYVAPDMSQQQLDLTKFWTARKMQPPSFGPLPGNSWPTTANVAGAVDITYTAGFDTTGTQTCPARYREGIRQLVVHLYEHPEMVTGEPLKEAPLAITAFFTANRTPVF